MRTPIRRMGEWILINPSFSFIFCLTAVFNFSANAQLAGQLPVNLKTFKARAENNNRVKVFWTTEYERNNAYFDIERSVDGVYFISVGRVAGSNNNGILTNYIYYDLQALPGISFYRLRQVDTDLKFSFSPVERVRNATNSNAVDMYPNPVNAGLFTINLLKNVEGNIEVMVYDLLGRLQLKQQFSDKNTLTIIHHLSAGLYTVKITAKEFVESKHLVVQ